MNNKFIESKSYLGQTRLSAGLRRIGAKAGTGIGAEGGDRPADFKTSLEPPIADPHDGWCGEDGLDTRPYPIKF